MKLIVGLGNPGDEYKNTRHNVGFMCIDAMLEKLGLSNTEKEKFQGLIVKTKLNGEDVLLFKPTTYMNSSGLAVREVVDFYKLTNEDVLVIHDDMDFGVGAFKIKANGSPAGHNGIKSIIANLGTQEFKRVRVGIGRPPRDGKVDYVLSRFNKEEAKELDKAIAGVCDAINDLSTLSFQNLMTKYNTSLKEK